MKRRRMPEMREGSVNVTPLIDIVMCLIIFFMLVAKIGVSTGAEAMTIPASILGTDLTDLGNTLTLNVRSGPSDEPMVTALIRNHVEELKIVDNRAGHLVHPLAEVLTALRQTNAEFKVIIRGEEDMDYRFLEPVLVACAEAKVKNVNFNTRKVEG